jgi:hypothetical protein
MQARRGCHFERSRETFLLLGTGNWELAAWGRVHAWTSPVSWPREIPLRPRAARQESPAASPEQDSVMLCVLTSAGNMGRQ